MAKIKVESIKGLNVPNEGPELVFDDSGNLNFANVNINSQNSRLGFNTSNPTCDLDVTGSITSSKGIIFSPKTENTKPVNPQIGTAIYNQDRGILEVWSGVQWFDITEIATTFEVVQNGLQLHLDSYNLNSYPGTGNIWFDISGNNRNFSGNSNFISRINGVRSGVNWTCPAGTVGNILNTDFHSIFFMIRFNATPDFPNGWSGAFNKIFEHTGTVGDRSPGVWRYPNNRTIHWRYNPNNTGADFGPASSSGDFPLNTWAYIGVVKNGSSAVSYVNGNIVASSVVSSPKEAGSTPINIFSAYPENLANINNIMIYNRSLTSEEVQTNFYAIRNRYSI
jgi:hypothetical protein